MHFSFLYSVADVAQLPPSEIPEVVVAGRSNVGKSSLINAVANKKGLAKTSGKPGHTRLLNYFHINDGAAFFVDIPGYGYAAAPKEEIARWHDLIFDYLQNRPTLQRLFLLIDSRHGIKQNDKEFIELLNDLGVPFQIVLTKVDKIKKGMLEKVTQDTLTFCQTQPAAINEVIATSASKNIGIKEMQKIVRSFVK